MTANFVRRFPVAVGGNGIGRVLNSSGSTVCASSQTGCYTSGSGSTTLSASSDIQSYVENTDPDYFPPSNSVFTGWSSDCSGTGDCLINLDGQGSVMANFAAALSASVDGSGSGVSTPAGIDCGASCAAAFDAAAVVTLTPTAAPGSYFNGWGGACTGTGACLVPRSAAKRVTATFATSTTLRLRISTSGTGEGYVR